MTIIFVLLTLLLGCWSVGRTECVETVVEGEFQTHPSNAPSFGTPITTGDDGAISICFITPMLRTVVARKHPITGVWTRTPVAPITANDPYHTQCSLAIDQAGYLHVVSNMHNTPWQYAVSQHPNSITPMLFRGQYAGTNPGRGTPALAGCTGICREQWLKDEPGIAAIPGNQITYPTFGYHFDGTIFLAFRECLYCNRSFFAREWSAGMAVYDHVRRTWSRVGNTRPWATQPDRLPLALRLYGDWTGRMHAAWLWCNHYNALEGGNGCFAYPNFFSYAYSDDRGTTWRRLDTATPLTLPITVAQSDVVIGPEWFEVAGAVGYHSGVLRLMSGPCRTPFLTIQPRVATSALGIQRGFLTGTPQQWTLPRRNGYAPMVTFQDHRGVWTGISSGVRIHRSLDNFATQTLTPIGVDKGPYQFAVDHRLLERSEPQVLRLYLNNTATGLLRIVSVRFRPGPCA